MGSRKKRQTGPNTPRVKGRRDRGLARDNGKVVGSATTGISKGIHPSSLVRTMCKRNRSYKHPFYDQFCELCRSGTVGKRNMTGAS